MTVIAKSRSGAGLILFAVLGALAGCDTQKGPPPGGDLGPPLPSVQPEPGKIRFDAGMADRIFFKYDSSAITPEARGVLERIAAWAKAYPQVGLIVEGHCDDRGTREYNLALGERRAEAARNAEIALGIEPGRLQPVSYGKERPAAIGETEAAWAQNRRAVFVIQ